MLPPKTYVINKNSPVLADLFKVKNKPVSKKVSSKEP